jgi:hypothetical protein
MYLLRCMHLIVKNLILSNQEKTLLYKYIYPVRQGFHVKDVFY